MASKSQLITASTTFTPTTSLVWITLLGGGGAGGAGGGGILGHGGGGGASGEFLRRFPYPCTVGVGETVTIGAGGTANTNPSAFGGNGGTTTFGTRSVMGGYGGVGGATQDLGNPQHHGSFTGGGNGGGYNGGNNSGNTTGAAGSQGLPGTSRREFYSLWTGSGGGALQASGALEPNGSAGASCEAFAGGSGGPGHTTGGGSDSLGGGGGGSSIFGRGGSGPAFVTGGADGVPGDGFGAGGSGATSQSFHDDKTGGAGISGAVLVEWME